MGDSIIPNNGSDRAVVEGDPNAVVPAKKDDAKEEAAFVRRQAYEEVSRDMHKFKEAKREAEARAAEYEAKLKAMEERDLIEANKFQELYEREKQSRAMAEEKQAKDRQLYLRAVKMSALKAELGNVKDEYLTHAGIDEIDVNDDGTLSSESVREVANKFRQEHPVLIPTDASGNITNYASPTSFNPSSTKEKSLSEMSYEEKAQKLKEIKNNRS